MVFCLSTFLAGVSGATFAAQFAATNQASFNYVQSLIVLAVMAISGRRTITIAVVAPILIYVIPGYITSATANLYLQLGFGVAAVVAAAISQGSLTRLFDSGAAAAEERLLDPVFGAGRAPMRTSGGSRRATFHRNAQEPREPARRAEPRHARRAEDVADADLESFMSGIGSVEEASAR